MGNRNALLPAMKEVIYHTEATPQASPSISIRFLATNRRIQGSPQPDEDTSRRSRYADKCNRRWVMHSDAFQIHRKKGTGHTNTDKECQSWQFTKNRAIVRVAARYQERHRAASLYLLLRTSPTATAAIDGATAHLRLSTTFAVTPLV